MPKALCILLMVAGFLICAGLLYVANIEQGFPYPNGDMTVEEIKRADEIIAKNAQFKRRMATLAAAIAVMSGLALRMMKQHGERNGCSIE